MNKKAVFTPITVAFYLILFLIIFFMFGASFLGYWSSYAVEANNLTGVEAFLLNNMVIWFVLIVVVAVMAMVYISGGE